MILERYRATIGEMVIHFEAESRGAATVHARNLLKTYGAGEVKLSTDDERWQLLVSPRHYVPHFRTAQRSARPNVEE